MIAFALIIAAVSIGVFLWGVSRQRAAPAREVALSVGEQLTLDVGARFCSSEALFERSIDAALADPGGPLISGCWSAGAPTRATVLGFGERANLIRVNLEGVGEGWVQRDALSRA